MGRYSKIVSHFFRDDMGGGGYFETVTLSDMGGGGSVRPLKKVTSFKYSP